MSDESWLPRFEDRDGRWIVHLGGVEWCMLTCPRLDPRGETYTAWNGIPRGSIYDRVMVSFEMMRMPPPPDLSIPDNIILGDN